MSFERLGDALNRKDIDQHEDLLAFFDLAKSVIARRSGVKVDAVSFKNDILRIAVSHPVEASEIRLRHIQIEREISKKSGRKLERLQVRVL
ncbi:MAG: hypothetical protein U0526_02935 [Candidatus Saccharibacteria bacterium]